jgi:hypothetical protein
MRQLLQLSSCVCGINVLCRRKISDPSLYFSTGQASEAKTTKKHFKFSRTVVAKKLPIYFTCLSNLTINHQTTDTQRKKFLYLLRRDWKHRRKLEDETERNLQELEEQHEGT